jgi:hypothetical protein
MALQLPEPEYYKLAEVANRWDVLESYLLRLGAEGKLELAWPIPDSIYVSITSDVDNPGTVEEVERLFPSLPPRHLQFRVAKKAVKGLEGHEILGLCNSPALRMQELWEKIEWMKIEISVSGLAFISKRVIGCDTDKLGELERSEFTRCSCYTGSENTVHEQPDPTSFWSYQIRESKTTQGGALPPLPDGYYFETTSLVPVDEIIVPTAEVRRIESQHIEAEKAASADVLSGSVRNSRRILLTVINALCEKADIDPKGRDATSKIMRLLELQGTPAAEHTIRDAIKSIPEAVRYRKDKSK